MKFEVLIQFIVPLTFLAIWALTSILNRDAQPLPPRPGRPPGTGGPGVRPGAGGMGQPNVLTSGGLTGRPGSPPAAGTGPGGWTGLGAPPGSTSPPLPQPRPRPNLGNPADAIVYLESDQAARASSRPATAQAGTGSNGARPLRAAPARRGRARTGTPSAAPRAQKEPETPRVLSDQVNQSMARERNKPLSISPLGASFSSAAPAFSPSGAMTPFSSPQPQTQPPPRPPDTAEIRTLLASPAKLREVFVLTEILRPPVALRRRQKLL